MLNESELSAWYERLHISSLARSVIEQVRSSPPARPVGGGSRNVSGRYPTGLCLAKRDKCATNCAPDHLRSGFAALRMASAVGLLPPIPCLDAKVYPPPNDSSFSQARAVVRRLSLTACFPSSANTNCLRRGRGHSSALLSPSSINPAAEP